MSHWVNAPRVEDGLSGKTLLDLSDKLWDLLRVEEGEEKLILVLRKYPGISKEVQIVIGKDGQMFLNDVLCDETQLKAKLRDDSISYFVVFFVLTILRRIENTLCRKLNFGKQFWHM